MGVNNGYDIGVNGRDLILKTSGKIYVKVAEKFYELDFRNTKQDTQTAESSQSREVKTSDIVFLDTLSKETYPGDNKLVVNNDELYITKGGFYKQINVATSSTTEDVATSSTFEETTDVVVEDNLFVKITDDVWCLGDSVSFDTIEIIDEPVNKWNDALFFNSVKDYFFDEVSGLSDDDINKLFFNNTTDSVHNWTVKTKNEIEQTVLTNVAKNGQPVTILDFKNLYNSFWFSNALFNTETAMYTGQYISFSFDKWSNALRTKSKITIGNTDAIIISVIDDTVVAKLKDNSIQSGLINIQKTSGSVIVYKNDDISFIDVLNSNTNVYNDAIQNENDICVRIGNLDTLQNHSGTGAFFNRNITIKNGPFTLNQDGSGNIGAQLKWNTNGELSGTYVDSVNNKIASLENQLESLNSWVTDLTFRIMYLENWKADLENN